MDKSKILVLGSETGFLAKAYKNNGYELFGREQGFDININNTKCFDVLLKKLTQSEFDYEAIINTIGCSDTRLCETKFQNALDINGKLPNILSHYCNLFGIKFLHISTGCLYDNYEWCNS